MTLTALVAEPAVSPQPDHPAQPVRPTFISSIATVLGGQIACSIVALGIEICYARLLGPSGRGQITLCMMAIALGTLLGGLGGEIPIVLWTANSKHSSAEWLPAVLFWGAVGSCGAAATWSFIYWRWHPSFLQGVTHPLALIVAAAIPVTVFFSYFFAILTGLESFRLRAGLSVASQIVELFSIVLLVVLFGRTAEMAMLGILSGLLIGTAITVVTLKKPLKGIWNLRRARQRLGSALSLGLRGQLGDLATFFNYRLDVFIVNFFLGPAQVGLYSVGVVISEGLWQVPQAAAVALFPRTARTIERGAAEFTCLITRQVLSLALVLGIALAIACPILIPFLFGARFNPAIAVIWWILPGTIALSLGKVISADLAARGKPEFSSIFAVISLAVTVALDFLLIPPMGIQGAALASSAAYFVDSALLAITLKRILKVTWRTLLVPTSAEFVAYQNAWRRLLAQLRAVALPESAGATD